ncbi:MAG: hypothetical protein VXW67_06710 [Bacteroidota bacterium]|nr:hypothetical protein [Bacteroidota bacterium]
MKKSWIDKFNQPREKMIKVLDTDFSDMKVGEKMLIATPKIIDEYINQVPKSYTVDMKTMRKDLALTHQADVTCPVTTGIFLRVVSEASFEKIILGEKNPTPFWRVVDPKSNLAKKLACGSKFIRDMRALEAD